MMSSNTKDTAIGVLPNFIIIGAMKSGTTSLARYLGSHPEVFMATQKEVHFFDRHYDLGAEWYMTQFADVKDEVAVGEATPGYMSSDGVIEKMAKLVPDAKLIAVLRNPVDRAYSAYWHQRARGRETLDFSDAIEAEPTRLASGDETHLMYHDYLDRGRYLKQFLHLRESYQREALHVIISEDLRNTPVETFQTVCRAIGVDDTFVPPNLGVEFNHYVSFRSNKLRNLLWGSGPYRKITRRFRKILGRINTSQESYPPMDPSLRSELLKAFEADNAELARWLGRDLSIWNR